MEDSSSETSTHDMRKVEEKVLNQHHAVFATTSSNSPKRDKSILFKSPKPNIKSRDENIFGDGNIVVVDINQVEVNAQQGIDSAPHQNHHNDITLSCQSNDNKGEEEDEDYVPWWELEMRKAKAIRQAIQETPPPLQATLLEPEVINATTQPQPIAQISLSEKNKAYFKQKKQVFLFYDTMMIIVIIYLTHSINCTTTTTTGGRGTAGSRETGARRRIDRSSIAGTASSRGRSRRARVPKKSAYC